MSRSIVLTNHKGGVGKTTTAANTLLGLVQFLRHFKAKKCKNPLRITVAI